MASLYNQGTYSYPDINIPDSKKDEKFHKQFVQAIGFTTFNSQYDFEYRTIEECQNFYQGTQVGDEFGFLMDAPDGTALPAKWINFNKIKTKVNLLVGELIKRGYRIDINSINKEAKVRKLQAREEARVDLRLQPYVEDLEKTGGIPLMQKRKFEDEQEIEDYYNYNYKEKSEHVMKVAIDYCLRKGRWEYERLALFRDIIINNRAFGKVELINGIPRIRRIDPKYFIWDRNATDDFLSDGSYFGEVRYMDLGDAASKYDVKKKELEEIYNRHNSSMGAKFNSPKSMGGFLEQTQLDLFKVEGGSLKVLVIEACWADYKKFTAEKSVDKFGNEHYRFLTEETKERKDRVAKNIKTWRKGVLLGGEILKDWGEIKNQPRSIDDFAETGCPYFALVPNFLNKQSVSLVEDLKGLQELKNITMYNVQLAMARAGAKGFVYDVAQMPDDWEVDEVLKYLKVAGIAFINSAKDEIPATFNQFQQFDMSLSSSVKQYIEISFMIDKYMDEVSGVNEARQGIVQSASQAVGVTKMSAMASSLTTESLFDLFRQYSENLYTYMAGLIKIAWANKDRFAPIIGDAGVNFLSNDVGLEMDDYAVFVEQVPEGINNPEMLNQIVLGAMQSGKIEFVQGIKILNNKDIDYAIRELERYLMVQERKAMQAQKDQMEGQQAMQQQQLQAQSQQNQMKIEGKMAEVSTAKSIEGQNKLNQISTKGKVDLIKQGMKEKGDTNRAKISKTSPPERDKKD